MDDRRGPLVIIILDGFGIDPDHTIVRQTPFISWAFAQYGCTLLNASGTAVGLLPGMPGNSYVGHITLGAGKIIEQPVTRLHKIQEQGEWNSLPFWSTLLQQNKGNLLHIMGLCSSVGTHGLTQHITQSMYAFAHAHEQYHIPLSIALHLIADGRDTYAQEFLSQYQMVHDATQDIARHGVSCQIASIAGRAYAMPRTMATPEAQHYLKLFQAQYPLSKLSVEQTVYQAYAQGLSDEYIPPTKYSPWATLQDHDTCFFTQIRPERVIPLMQSLADRAPHALQTGMICYDITRPNESVIPAHAIKPVLLDALITRGYRILVTAESEKEAHITRFLYGDNPHLPPEISVVIHPSDYTLPFWQQPALQAIPITQTLIQAAQSQTYQVLIANYAHADMMGHTGNQEAIRATLSVLDESLEALYSHIVQDMGGTLIITADHGNIEDKLSSSSYWHGHTQNKVPFTLLSRVSYDTRWMKDLADIAPCVVSLLDAVGQAPDR